MSSAENLSSPALVKRYGTDYTKEAWKDAARTGLAVGIAAGILWMLMTLIADPSRTQALLGVYPILGIWFAIDFIWAISYTVWPRRTPAVKTQTTSDEVGGEHRRRCRTIVVDAGGRRTRYELALPNSEALKLAGVAQGHSPCRAKVSGSGDVPSGCRAERRASTARPDAPSRVSGGDGPVRRSPRVTTTSSPRGRRGAGPARSGVRLRRRRGVFDVRSVAACRWPPRRRRRRE